MIKMVACSVLTGYLDEYLNIKNIKDKWMLNGLVVEGKKDVNKIICGVDPSMELFERAVKEHADMIITHHGLIPREPTPITHTLYKRLKILMDNSISLYVAHIPLDMHPEIGNNAQFFKLLNIPIKEKFGEVDGEIISFIGELEKEMSMDELVQSIEKIVNDKCSHIYRFGNNKVKRIAFISGSAPYEIAQAIAKDVDVYITGSIDSIPYLLAKDAKINFIAIGHHSSETLGIIALADVIKNRFNIEAKFIDIKTGGI